ncbi:hypothetical protein [Niallia sp. 03133]|uniref:hypothetical protein n=1 Tax=Niallia sp. 03133 TaxID=3458060 RepID=UPI004044BEC1
MANRKRTKWIIGLSSVAAFTGFIGFLNKSDSTGKSDDEEYNNQPEQTMPNSQNPFSTDNSSQNNGSSTSGGSWSGGYEGAESENTTDSFSQPSITF